MLDVREFIKSRAGCLTEGERTCREEYPGQKGNWCSGCRAEYLLGEMDKFFPASSECDPSPSQTWIEKGVIRGTISDHNARTNAMEKELKP
jgi:hypothetical protein